MTQRPPEGEERLDQELEEDELFSRKERGDRRQRPRVVSDFVRRAIENTVGSVQPGTISRDALSYVLQQGDRGKREVMRIVAKEVGDFLRQVDISSEVVKILSSLQVEVSATVRFKPTEGGGVQPDVAAGSKIALVDASGRDLLEDTGDLDSDRPRTADPVDVRDGDER